MFQSVALALRWTSRMRPFYSGSKRKRELYVCLVEVVDGHS